MFSDSVPSVLSAGSVSGGTLAREGSGVRKGAVTAGPGGGGSDEMRGGGGTGVIGEEEGTGVAMVEGRAGIGVVMVELRTPWSEA